MSRITRCKLPIWLPAAATALLLLLPIAGQAAKPTTDGAVQRGLERLVGARGGPPGAIATLHRGGRRPSCAPVGQT
jgi:hypothetical protein